MALITSDCAGTWSTGTRRRYAANQPQVWHTSTAEFTDKTCLMGAGPRGDRRGEDRGVCRVGPHRRGAAAAETASSVQRNPALTTVLLQTHGVELVMAMEMVMAEVLAAVLMGCRS